MRAASANSSTNAPNNQRPLTEDRLRATLGTVPGMTEFEVDVAAEALRSLEGALDGDPVGPWEADLGRAWLVRPN